MARVARAESVAEPFKKRHTRFSRLTSRGNVGDRLRNVRHPERVETCSLKSFQKSIRIAHVRFFSPESRDVLVQKLSRQDARSPLRGGR